jgi:glycosyltransferase involved in cell wall biosynthesis
MKILHLLSQRPELTGSGVYLKAVMHEAEAHGHQNYLLAGIPSTITPVLECVDAQNCTWARFESGALPFPVVGMSDVMPYKSRRFVDLSAKEVLAYEDCFGEKIASAVKKFAPDIIHSHHLWLMTATARRLFPRIPLVASCHGSDLRQFENCRHLQKKVTEAVSQIDGIMALSRIQAQQIKKVFGLDQARIHIVGGGYNDQMFKIIKKSSAPPVEILYAGKLSDAKGVPWLLNTLNKLKSLPWRLHLVGGGSGVEKETCLELARKLGERVVIYGALSQERLAVLMQKAHIFVLASFFEGVPLVLLEAIACGCRIVATALPGTAEILKDADSDIVRLIDLPPLETIDAPYAKDVNQLETLLSQALKTQIETARQYPDVEQSHMQEMVRPHTWHQVYGRIEKVYGTVYPQAGGKAN